MEKERVNGHGQTEQQEQQELKLVNEIVERLKGVTTSTAKRMLEIVNYHLEQTLVLT